MSKRFERRRARQTRKYQKLRRKRGTWKGMSEDMLAAYRRILRRSTVWYRQRPWKHGPVQDIHVEKAAELFGVVNDDTRARAKVINFAFMYGFEVEALDG